MPNVHTTLTSLFTAIANSIRGKTGSSAQIVADDFPSAIDAIPTGTPLPALTDPASASDILDGKEAIDGQGQVLTGTLVPPVDTGANGLYKAMIEENVTEIVDEGLTVLRPYAQYGNTSLVTISLPNVLQVGANAFSSCNNLTGIIDFSSAALAAAIFTNSLRLTVVIKAKTSAYLTNESKYIHGWFPNITDITGARYQIFSKNHVLKTLQCDNNSSINFTACNGQHNNFVALILRKQTMTNLSAVGTLAHSSTDFHIYVPAPLVNDYKTATNWTTYASLMVGIDEDTTGTVGTPFTPTTSATVDHWDKIDLQSYSVGTVDTTNGSITPTHDGRLLIRGLDSSDNIVHVTYLQIGTGFDEEANLA